MPAAPAIVGQTVSYAQNLPVFVTGALHLVVIPPNTPPNKKIDEQSPEAGTMLDVGGTVTAMVWGG